VFTARYELGMYFSLVFTIFVSRFNCLVCVMQIEHGVCVCVCVCVFVFVFVFETGSENLSIT